MLCLLNFLFRKWKNTKNLINIKIWGRKLDLYLLQILLSPPPIKVWGGYLKSLSICLSVCRHNFVPSIETFTTAWHSLKICTCDEHHPKMCICKLNSDQTKYIEFIKISPFHLPHPIYCILMIKSKRGNPYRYY